MDIDDRLREAVEEVVAEQLHVAGEHHQAGAPAVHPVGQLARRVGAVGVGAAGEGGGGDALFGGTLQGGGSVAARGDGDDLRLAAVDGVDERLQVGAGARDEHGDGERALAWRAGR